MPVEHLANEELFAGKHLENSILQTREVGPDIMITDDQKMAPMIFSKRAPMRFGKQGLDTDLSTRDFLRPIRAPMRFGKRAPMRFGKRYVEEPESILENFGDVGFSKRAPMRFGKRNNDYEDLNYSSTFDYFGNY